MPSFPRPQHFPPPSAADPEGLLAVDPQITPEKLEDAYRHGIFPWPAQYRDTWWTGWFSPDPRAILPLENLHVPRRLARKLQSGRFQFTCDADFETVLSYCATIGVRRFASWLSPALRRGMLQLHRRGTAHSIEVYDARDLSGGPCGGLYGVAAGGAFSAESMFHLTGDASKAAVVALVHVLRQTGFGLLDIQMTSPHMQALGAIEVARDDYLGRLAETTRIAPRPWPTTVRPRPLAELCSAAP